MNNSNTLYDDFKKVIKSLEDADKTRKQLLGSMREEIEKLFNALEELKKEQNDVSRLKAIIDQLPKDGDGQPIVPGQDLWVIGYVGGLDSAYIYTIKAGGLWNRGADGVLYVANLEGGGSAPAKDCHATEEAAEKALKDMREKVKDLLPR